jgi:hypothetical protein
MEDESDIGDDRSHQEVSNSQRSVNSSVEMSQANRSSVMKSRNDDTSKI